MVQHKVVLKRFLTRIGAEIDDVMCIEDDDMLFFSAGDPFRAPDLNPGVENAGDTESGGGTDGNSYMGVVGGYKIGAFLGKGGFGEVRQRSTRMREGHA